MTFFGLCYDLFLHLYALSALPKMAASPKKYRGTLLKRLGINFPHIEKKERQLLWIHAVSLGETKAVLPLIKRFKNQSSPPLILLSTTTKTGHQEGLNQAVADYHVYLPFDFRYVIGPIMKRVAPDLVILTETDFWYHFQQTAKESGAQLVVINGKISERSCKRLSKFPFFSKALMGSVDHFFLQSELYKKRLLQLNIPAAKLTVTGNLKLESEVEIYDSLALKKQLGITSQPILTLGSTHSPEEQLFIKAYKQLRPEFPQLKLLIVPRHPERFQEVAHLLERENVNFSLWSQEGNLQTNPVLLVDKMGVLKQCYQISDLAFVGGSFAKKVGGHNILEPLFYGKPVLFGPYMHSQPDFLELVHTYNCGIQLDEENLVATIRKLLKETELRQMLGKNGEKLIAASRGALDKTYQPLLCLLQKDKR